MSMTLDRSSRKVVARIKGLNKLTKEGLEAAAHTSGKGLVKATSTEILRKPKGGRTYIRVDRIGRRRKHIASAPGETHANMTGTLRRSLGFNASSKRLEFGYGVKRKKAPYYAGFVEFGTTKMAPRPSLENGIKSQHRNFQSNIDREIANRINGRVL